MIVYVQRRGGRNEHALLDRLRDSIGRLGHEIVYHPSKADLSVVWGWERMHEDQPTIHCEQGWLPRWSYQVSSWGINAESHVRLDSLPYATPGQRQGAFRYLQTMRESACGNGCRDIFAYADPTAPQLRGLPARFCLVPLQVEVDRNREGSGYASMQDFVDEVSYASPPWPIVFREHPALLARNQSVEVRRERDRFEDRGTVHQYLKHPGCRAVVALNSNVVHDALIWGVPAIALDRGVWPDHRSPFMPMLPKRERDWFGLKPDGELVLDYVAHLMREQWTLERAESLRDVEEMLETAKEIA